MQIPVLLRRTIFTVVSLGVALIVITAVVNFSVFDESLNPDIAAMLDAPTAPAADDNAYAAMWGLQAGANRNMIEVGLGVLERLKKNEENTGSGSLLADDIAEFYGEFYGNDNPDNAWLRDFHCNARTTTGCLSFVRENLNDTPVDTQRAKLLKQRYQAILTLKQYVNTSNDNFASPLPPFVHLLDLGRLTLAELSLSGTPTAFIQQVGLDMQFWKMVLEDGTSILDKMVAVAAIWSDVQFLSDYLTLQELSDSEISTAVSIMQPLSLSQLDISDAFDSEQRVVYQTLKMIDKHQAPEGFSALVTGWLIQPNTTQNSYYEHMIESLKSLSAASIKTFREQTHIVNEIRTSKNHQTLKEMVTIWPGTPYNIGGKLFLKTMSGDYTAYIARVYDVNSMIGLVNMQLQLQLNDDLSIENAIRYLEDPNFNLASSLQDIELKYDSTEGWVEFDCLYGPRSICKLRF